MKRLLLSAAALLWVAVTPGVVRADDALKRIQQSLHDQGFYYGSVDGAPGDETTQAIRRYQIRNGLQVTGQLNDETRAAILKNSGGSAGGGASSAARDVSVAPSGAVRPRSTPSVSAQPTPRATPRATPNVRADESDDDGGFHRGDASAATPPPYRPAPAVRPAPGPDDADNGGYRPAARQPDAGGQPDLRAVPPNGIASSPRLTAVFTGTPYEFAPPPVQTNVLRRAQNKLLRQGFYDQEPDGRPNPLTAEALTNFQGFNHLRRTGRLDTETLAALRLLPGERRGGPNGDFGGGPGPGGVFQGRVVQ